MISVTLLSSYIYCQRKLYLTEVLGMREPVNAAIVRGTIRHKVHEKINEKEEEIVKNIIEKDFDIILNIYKEKHFKILTEIIKNNKEKIKEIGLEEKELFNDIAPFVLKEGESRAKNIFELIEQYNVFGEELWEKVTPKAKSEFRIESKNLNLKGIIDRVDVYEKELIPFELKTGKMPLEGVWPGHKVQIAAYCMLLEDYFGTRIKKGTVHYVDNGEQRDVVMNPFLRAEIAEMVIKVQNIINSKNPPPITKNQAKCNICGLKENCFNVH